MMDPIRIFRQINGVLEKAKILGKEGDPRMEKAKAVEKEKEVGVDVEKEISKMTIVEILTIGEVEKHRTIPIKGRGPKQPPRRQFRGARVVWGWGRTPLAEKKTPPGKQWGVGDHVSSLFHQNLLHCPS